MSLKRLLVMGMAATGLALTGCGDDNGGGGGGRDLQGEDQAGVFGGENGLNGTWISECRQVETIVDLDYEQRILTIEGGNLQRELRYFNDPSCEDDAKFVVTMQGSINAEQDEDAAEDENHGTIDIDLQSATAVGRTEAVVEKLNEFVYCGRGGWVVDEEREITGEFTAGACPVLRVPDQRYGSYRVDEDTLRLDAYIDEMADEESERGESLSVTFTREDDVDNGNNGSDDSGDNSGDTAAGA